MNKTMNKARIIAIAAAFLSVVLSFSAGAQEPLDSLIYAMPQFVNGTVVFDNGGSSNGNVNICIVDQTLRYIDPASGDTLVVENNGGVVRVIAGKRVFYRNGAYFIELMEMYGDIVLGLQRSTTLVNVVQTGAYGMASTTSSINSYRKDDSRGNIDVKNIDEQYRDNHSYKTSVYLLKDGKFFTATKKNLQKLFPAGKAQIEAWFKDGKADISDLANIRSLIESIQ